jgi:hypothetical protein
VAQVNAYDGKNTYWSFPSPAAEQLDEALGCPGELVLDVRRVPLRPDIPPGHYTAEVVVLNSASGQRVPFVGLRGDRVERVELGGFWIRPPGVSGPGELPPPQAAQRYELGDQIALVDWRVTGHAAPGSPVTVETRWQALAAPTTDYTAFVHLSDATGKIVAQFDAQPTDGVYPTSAWLPGESVVEQHTLTLPPALPPGPLTVSVGLYNLASLQRLPVSEGGDEIHLASLDPG